MQENFVLGAIEAIKLIRWLLSNKMFHRSNLFLALEAHFGIFTTAHSNYTQALIRASISTKV